VLCFINYLPYRVSNSAYKCTNILLMVMSPIFRTCPQQSTNARTNTDTSWDLHFCTVSSIIIGETMTQVTHTINGKTSQMACRSRILTQMDMWWKRTVCFVKSKRTSHTANSMHYLRQYTFLYKYPGNYIFS